jgi:hypothetical protein
MAAITVTTNLNKDDPLASIRLSGEATNINGGTFLINSDVRWGQNTSVIGNVLLSQTLGGNFIIDASETWELPFTALSGVVPSLGSIGTNTVNSPTALGELLRVWETGSKTPLNAGDPLPATGWIKLRGKVGDFQAGQQVILPNESTITITSPGKRSWIHFVGGSSNSISTSSIGMFETRGDWYELDVTSGSRDQQIQYPVTDICPAIQIETSPGSNEYEWWLSAGGRWGAATKFVALDERGKFFGCTNQGVITLALSGANECGFLPPAGCRIRIPNIILSYSSSVNWNNNLQNTTLTSRFACNSVNYGYANLQFLCGALRLAVTNANAFNIRDCALFDQILFNNVQPFEFRNVAIGLSGTLSQSAISILNSLNGATLKNITAVMYSSATASNGAIALADSENMVVEDVDLRVFGGTTTVTRGSPSSSTLYATKVLNSAFKNLNLQGARFGLLDCDFIGIDRIRYCDPLIGETSYVNGQAAVSIAQSSAVTVNDYAPLYTTIPNIHPYVAIVEMISSDNIDVRNLGDKFNVIDCGDVNPTGAICTSNLSKKLYVTRAYAINTRVAPFTVNGITDQIYLTDVRSDYTDTGMINGHNVIIKGCSKTPYSLAQIGNHGRIWEDGFSSPTVGFITLCANQPTGLNINEVEVTGGSPLFSSAGNIYFMNAGDQVVWKMPYFALGHKSLTTLTTTVVNNPNFVHEFQFDKGDGINGVWRIINSVNLAAVGQIDPSIGIKLWIRVTAKVSSSTNRISYLRINTTTDAEAQLIEYPLPTIGGSVTRTLTLNGIKPLSEVRIYDSAMTELAGVEETDEQPFSYTYEYVAGTVVTIVVFNINYKAVRFEYTLPDVDSVLPIQQSLDRINNE